MMAPDFAELLRVEERVLAAQLRAVRASLTHEPEKGRGLEQHALALLRRLLPAEYGLATGFVACAELTDDGGCTVRLSPQTDVIIYDAIRGAPIVDLGSCQVLPLECVYAAVEVKASLYASVPAVYRWSAAIRSLTTRHYLFDPEREVDPQDEAAAALQERLDGFLTVPVPFRPPVPRRQVRKWHPVRCFALAFEYDSRQPFSLDAARERLSDAFVHPGHLHAVLVPDVCLLWNERADEDETRLGEVGGSKHMPLATFRDRLFDALANFPRLTVGATMDLRPYFESLPMGAAGP